MSNINQINHWVFENDEQEGLATAMALMADKNGVSVNEMMHIFPIVLRILKEKSEWSK